MHSHAHDPKFLSIAYHEAGHAVAGVSFGKTIERLELNGPLSPCDDFEGTIKFVESRKDDFADAVIRISGICAQYLFVDKNNLRYFVKEAGTDYELVRRFIEATTFAKTKRVLLLHGIFRNAVRRLLADYERIHKVVEAFTNLPDPDSDEYQLKQNDLQTIFGVQSP
ncbi:hypothetical protein [Turneriella parva]|uniref:Peptidase M41 n=1 Tax=Turneriella parva (strain ATCC BAA-1111 / DSM 21527 / NCTC 11395 / H) TaxID=869212 RepID=I4B096_TURPD|nr:hypothetical protein [Turneriella parva]AFM10703.1 hypothetical protein Turpa_0040 [Turneriella parva DSM 21527]